MGLKAQLNLHVFVPLFLTVAIVLIQNSIFIQRSNDEALQLMKSHFREIGIDYILQKNSLQQVVFELQLQQKRSDLSVMRTMLESQERKTLHHVTWQPEEIYNSGCLPLTQRMSTIDANVNSGTLNNLKKYYLWHEPNFSTTFSTWSSDMQAYFTDFMYLLDIIPAAYANRQMYSIDPKSGLALIYPIETQLPGFAEVNTSYMPKQQKYYIDTVQNAQNKLGSFYYNRPFWNKTDIVTPFCSISQLTAAENFAVRGVTCINIDLGTPLHQLVQGMGEIKNLQSVYSYLVTPVTREIMAITSYNVSSVISIDEFEFGQNYQNSSLYKDFKKKTTFLDLDPLVYKDLPDCFDRENLPVTIEFVDETGETFLLVLRDIDFCLRNQNNKFNLVRVAYIGTAINVSHLNQFIIANLTTMTIIRELSMLVNTVSICGVCLAVAFVSFYFSDEIFAPIENLAKGMKRVDSVSIKVIHKQLEAVSSKSIANQETFEPLFAYYNLQTLISKAISLYTKGQTEESLEAFAHAQELFHRVGNYEGEHVCKHNQGIIHLLKSASNPSSTANTIQKGVEFLESSLDYALGERVGFVSRYAVHGITEIEIMTDERYFCLLITISRRSFVLFHAYSLLRRANAINTIIRNTSNSNPFNRSSPLSNPEVEGKPNQSSSSSSSSNNNTVILSRQIELLQGIIEIQEALKSFGKVSSVYVYAHILLAQAYLQLPHRYEDAETSAATAAELLEIHKAKVQIGQLQYFSIPVLEQGLLVLEASIQEQKGNLHEAADLFTKSIEEGEEYLPKYRLEALSGLARIFRKKGVEDPLTNSIDEMLRSYGSRPKDLYFLVDSNLFSSSSNNNNFSNTITESPTSSSPTELALIIRERIITSIAETHETQASQFTCMSQIAAEGVATTTTTEIRMDFFRRSSNEIRNVSNSNNSTNNIAASHFGANTFNHQITPPIISKSTDRLSFQSPSISSSGQPSTSTSLSVGLTRIASKIDGAAAIADSRISTYVNARLTNHRPNAVSSSSNGNNTTNSQNINNTKLNNNNDTKVHRILFVLCDLSVSALTPQCVEDRENQLLDYTVILIDFSRSNSGSSSYSSDSSNSNSNRNKAASNSRSWSYDSSESHNNSKSIEKISSVLSENLDALEQTRSRFHYVQCDQTNIEATFKQIMNLLQEPPSDFEFTFEYLH